ncbi:unnamed protein product [Tilletia caries]|nr:unnamed protein product [Tilletia caries]
MDQDAVRAAMQAELDGVDAIARFRFDDDFNIYSFGQTIDAIPNASPGLTASLRKVVYAFDEPDTHAEAFQSTPSLSFPQSQERFRIANLEGGPEAGVNTSAEAIAAQASSASMDTTENTTNAVGKLEAFTTYIHRSVQRKADFRKRMAKDYHLDETGLANAPFPSKPNKTRWNSHYAMMRGALKIRVAIDAHCRAHIGVRNEVLGDYLLTDSQWRQLTLMEPILKLAMAVTKEFPRLFV